MTNTKKINCPSCNKQILWNEQNKSRPFCSERCKLIDFGEWASDKNIIKGESLYPIKDNSEDKLQ
ncbi:MAG: DNA gyrase inhibitor YacG [Gammaproteobacteria bacterium]|nr:DNA gyrase inhibitor YacG [Gammaproteobacteria bacterium]